MAVGQLQMFSPIWQLFDNNGKPLIGGAIFFFEAQNHNAFKNVYRDNTGQIAWPNPLILNAAGFQPSNYGVFGLGSYYIEVRKTSDRSSQLIFSQDNYVPPQTSSQGSGNLATDIQNFIRNGQFTITGKQYDAASSSVPTSILDLAPGGWVFVKNNNSSNDLITFPAFIAGQTDVPANPNNYFKYQCNTISTTESLKYLGYRLYNYSNSGLNAGSGVNTLSGKEVTIQFEGRSTPNTIISFSVYQYFGANGSAPVLTSVATFNLSTEWSSSANGTPSSTTFAIPSIEGKTIDPAGGDYLELRWNLPLNSVCQISIVNASLQHSASPVDLQPIPINLLESNLVGTQLPILSTQNQDYLDGNYENVQLMGSTTWSRLPMAGRIIYWPVNTAPSYGLICNGFPFYSNQYYNLAQVLYDHSQGRMPWGIGPNGFLPTNAGDTVTATCISNGLVVSGSAGTTPFTYTQTNNGSSSTLAVATIQCTAASAITPGMYFFINSPATSFYVWYSLNNFTPDPGPYVAALSGKVGVKVIYTGTDTVETIAYKTALQIQLAHTRVPDFRGLFIRMCAQGVAAVLPSYTNIIIHSNGNDSGINIAISGFDFAGNPVSENLTGANVGNAISVNKYQAIVSMTPSGVTTNTITAGDANNATGLCLLQSGVGGTPLLLNGAYQRDPDYLTRTLLYLTGGSAGNSGSFQMNQNLAHTHIVPSTIGTSPSGANNITLAQGPVYANASLMDGGNQSNPNNVYANAIILY